jgi:hypothetical protein
VNILDQEKKKKEKVPKVYLTGLAAVTSKFA